MNNKSIKHVFGMLVFIGGISLLAMAPNTSMNRECVNAAFEESQIESVEDSEVYNLPQPPATTEVNSMVVKRIVEPTITSDTVESSDMFEITAYCGENYPHICNNGDASTTATGTTPTAGRTIAVDPTVIPYGTQVIIDGHTYIAEDCGGAIKGNRIDLFFNTHEEALAWGRRTKEVTIIY